MKINWNIIKYIALLLVVLFLYVFSNNRNNSRKISGSTIEFVDELKPFMTHQDVSNMLIVNEKSVINIAKETLVLNELEATLNHNPMIDRAQVFLSVNGQLSATVKQKKPIARVSGKTAYYICSKGEYMPLSANYTARVPLVTGQIKKTDLATVYTIANKIIKDPFLKTNVVAIHQNNDKTIELKLRQCQFKVQLGSLSYLDKKISNLKAFYKKAIKDKSLKKYGKVNLQFENQVVCTKV